MQELEFQSSFWSNKDKTVALGKSINADYIVSFSYAMPSNAGSYFFSTKKERRQLTPTYVPVHMIDTKTSFYINNNKLHLYTETECR